MLVSIRIPESKTFARWPPIRPSHLTSKCLTPINQTCTCINEKVNTTDDYFQSDPLTSIADSTAPLSDLIFPGVTICNINQVYINQIINQQSIHQSNHQSNGYTSNHQANGFTSNHQLSINMTYWLSCILASAFLISTKLSIRYFWYLSNIQGAKIFFEKAGSSSKRGENQKATSPPDWEFHEGAINVHTSLKRLGGALGSGHKKHPEKQS